MEKYNVIIVGAGIAGAGLAYNLKNQGYNGSVLVIDKKEIGANKGHNIRSIFYNDIKKHNIPFFQKYKGIKMYVYDKEMFSINNPIYSVNYDFICKHFFNKSSSEFKKEEAINIKNNVLLTNRESYSFEYLIDCSGPFGFLRRQFNMPRPIRYWIANLKKIQSDNINLDRDYIHYSHGNNGYVEEINPHKDLVTYGDWQFVSKINFNLIKPHKNTILRKNIINPKIIETSRAVMVNSPQLPVIYKNFAFLGDSLGTSPTSSGAGIGPALDSSIILSKAIINKNLKYFEKEWKKTYLEAYIKLLINKIDFNTNNKFIKYIKNYPSHYDIFKAMFSFSSEEYSKLLNNPTYIPKFPEEFKKIFPKQQIAFRIYYYLMLKLRYKLIELKYNII